MDREAPPTASISGVARALLSTVGVTDGVRILVAQFGWDATFQALAALEGPHTGAALWRALHVLEAESR